MKFSELAYNDLALLLPEIRLEQNIILGLQKIKDKFNYPVCIYHLLTGENGNTFISIDNGGLKDHAIASADSKLEALKILTTKLAIKQYLTVVK